MRIGILETAYIKKYGLKDGCHLMRTHGYECLDYQKIASADSDFFKSTEADFIKQIKEERTVIEEEGITVNQAHSPWPHPIKEYTKEGLTCFFEAMAKGLRGAVALGAESYVIHPIMPYGFNSDENPREMIEMNADFFYKISELAREQGIYACIENMPFPKLPLGHVSQLYDFVKSIDHPNFKICIDTGHCLVCSEEPSESVRLVGKKYLSCLHVHDNNGAEDFHMLPGRGICNWSDFVSALRDIHFEGVFSLETPFVNHFGFHNIDNHVKEKELFDSVYRLING